MAQYIITNEPEEVDFECDNDAVARTLQNAKNLLMTRIAWKTNQQYKLGLKV